ncbi:MAG: WecB/TagA/CpsF family glycosyltransferase [Pseudanabaenaceae cyanobacterium bins.68]|nr:WecB/TagA/CpsF family glycosyltransferase [Pseudanabaenaceae cyanobacterium bins.68]
MTLQKQRVLGVPVDVHDCYGDWLTERLLQGVGTQVVTLNTEMVMQARSNPDLARVIEAAELAVPDGAGVVLYLRSLNLAIERCPGIELAETLVRAVGIHHKTLYLIGGAPGILELVVETWQKTMPQFDRSCLVGMHHGYFDALEEAKILQSLADQQPHLILVGLGVPRQELWIEQHRHLCANSIWIGVGGSFDVWSGVKQRAPKLMQNWNLEWLYRLYLEPWRWRRMLSIPQFAWCALQQRLGWKG